MNKIQLDIARCLADSARKKKRTTYKDVGKAVGWLNPSGRGLGANLDVILRYCAEKGLPPLTTIVVRKGKRYPEDDAMKHISAVLGDIDIEAAQNEVFAYDWTSVQELGLNIDALPGERQVWLTSFWSFDPDKWGCIGFSDQARRTRFVRESKPGSLVAIYITKTRGAKEERGNVVGVVEVSHETGPAQNFISGDVWTEKERDPEARGKWQYAVKVTRAWRVVPEDYTAVQDLFPKAYTGSHPELIGASGVTVEPEEAAALFGLQVYEVPVYGQSRIIDQTIGKLEASLTPSRAIRPPSKPYLVGETDGPKHLYILCLAGDIAAYLDRSPESVAGQNIIKVGFSKSPQARRDQIQGAYPRGSFNWKVFRPSPQPAIAPFANAEVAIAGEDAMKKRLVEDGAEVLGGEFFLADDGLILRAWAAGNYAANKFQNDFGT